MAARFRFRLESLLRVRKSLEEEARRRMARTVAARDLAQAKVQELREAHRGAVESRRVGKDQTVDLERWKAVERWLVALERRMRQAQEALAQAEARVAEARLALVKAHQDHLVLLRLKERRQAAHALEAAREEARDMDEIAVLRYHITHPASSNP